MTLHALATRSLLFAGSLLLGATGCFARSTYEPPPDGAAPPPPYAVAPAPVDETIANADLPPELAPFSQLDAYGRWFDYDGYGWVWMPTTVRSDWRPYEYGNWEWTDAGWYWQSDEPWGWATCHYGRWLYDGQYGWLWVPDTTWGPAWVEFRQGGDYVGWCPLAPGVMPGMGFDAWDGGWIFVDQDDFTNAHVYAHAVPPSRNSWMIGRTQVDGGVSTWHYENGGGGEGGHHGEHAAEITVPRGPDPTVIGHGHPPPAKHVEIATRPGLPAPAGGNAVQAVRPPISRELPTNRVQPAPGAVHMDLPPSDGQHRPEIEPDHPQPKPIPPAQRGVRHAPPVSKPAAPPPPPPKTQRTSKAPTKHKHA